MKKAFTLVELLVVIGIIAILASALLVSMSGGTESARAASCMSNMRNLASAVANGNSGYRNHYPLAGPVLKVEISEPAIGRRASTTYTTMPGWLNWSSSSSSSAGQMPYAYADKLTDSVLEVRTNAVNSGAIASAIGGKLDMLVCPQHKVDYPAKSIFFSYAMNEYFGWDSTGKPRSSSFYGVTRGRSLSGSSPDRMLVFAELQFAKDKHGSPLAGQIYTDDGTQTDSILQYKSKDELIGVNHRKGKESVAHVAFLDGHVEQIHMPRGGVSNNSLKELTKLLCTGKSWMLDNGEFKELNIN